MAGLMAKVSVRTPPRSLNVERSPQRRPDGGAQSEAPPKRGCAGGGPMALPPVSPVREHSPGPRPTTGGHGAQQVAPHGPRAQPVALPNETPHRSPTCP